LNKEITLELASQISQLGGDAAQALESGTFAPGEVGDPTGAGNTCDDQDDPEGCIFTQNLLVEDATAAEIDAAVSGAGGAADNVGGGAAAGDAAPAGGNATDGAAPAADPPKPAAADPAATGSGANNGATGAGANLQTFAGKRARSLYLYSLHSLTHIPQ